jgi:hypothetical protein
MIDLKDAYKEYETSLEIFHDLNVNVNTVIKNLIDLLFHLSILLYGIAKFIRKDLFYAGITCPSCLKTNLFMGCDLKKFIDDVSNCYDSSAHLDVELRYYSGVLHSPDQYPELKNFQIPYACSGISENFNNVIYHYSSKEELDQGGYLCSFEYDDPLPIGAKASVWWYLPDQIESLVELENEMEIKLFPRYVYRGDDSFYDRYDKFCWNYKLSLNLLERMKEHSHLNLKKLKEMAKAQNINFENLLEQNQDMITPRLCEYFISQEKESLSKDVKASSEFFDLLLNFDPYSVSRKKFPLSVILKTVSPFKEDIVPKTPEEIKIENFHASLTDAQIENIIDKILNHKDKKCVQKWLQDNYLKFIDDYVFLSQKTDFTYGDVWDLKLKYLEQLQNHMKTNLKYEAKNVFVQEGEGWLIRFGEEVISGLRGKGFKYLQYLVLNQNIDFSHKDLNLIDGVRLEHIVDVTIDPEFAEKDKASSETDEESDPDSDFCSNDEVNYDNKFYKSIGSKPTSDHLDAISGEALYEIINEYDRLKSEIQKAERK